MDGIKISQGLGLQDFDLIRVIGRGSYAKVLLVRLKKNDQIYAMKVVKKELVHDDEVTVCVNCILLRIVKTLHAQLSNVSNIADV